MDMRLWMGCHQDFLIWHNTDRILRHNGGNSGSSPNDLERMRAAAAKASKGASRQDSFHAEDSIALKFVPITQRQGKVRGQSVDVRTKDPDHFTEV